MTPDRKAILIFLGVSIVALGVAFGYRYQQEKKDIDGIQSAQEWAGRVVEGVTGKVETNEPECVRDYLKSGKLFLKDGSEFCLTWERETSVVDSDNMHDPMQVTHIFSFIDSHGERMEITRRVEGYRYSEANEYVEIVGVPKASYWNPIGISEDKNVVYFTRSQGLPLDGFSTGNRLDLWSLEIESGKLTQVFKTGDIWDYSSSPAILDIHIDQKLVIVGTYSSRTETITVVGFDGERIATLPSVPFEMEPIDDPSDRQEYEFSENGSSIIVTAYRLIDEPTSTREIKYGPAVFDIAKGRYLK